MQTSTPSGLRVGSRRAGPAKHVAARPPRPPQPIKATTAAQCQQLEQLPNVGVSIAADLRLIGVQHPRELRAAEPMALYRALSLATGKRQDPCVLDTFMAAVDFMQGAAPAPWWQYTVKRKALYGQIEQLPLSLAPSPLAVAPAPLPQPLLEALPQTLPATVGEAGR